jgi:hypothetical protein
VQIGSRSGRAERLRVACDHYLDLGRALREGSGSVAIWPCPSCGKPSFVARFEDGVAGCTEAGCGMPASMRLLELIAQLDEDLAAGDERAASKKFGEILEEAVRAEQERQVQRGELEQRAAQERRWQRGLTRARIEKEGWPQQNLFD